MAKKRPIPGEPAKTSTKRKVVPIKDTAPRAADVERTTSTRYPKELREEALRRIDAGERPYLIGADLGISGGVIRYWVKARATPPKPREPLKYSRELKAQALLRVRQGEQRAAVARALGVSVSMVQLWGREDDAERGIQPRNKRYTPEERQRAMDLAQQVGLDEAAQAIGAPPVTVHGWLLKAGLRYKGFNGYAQRETPVSHDKSFSWMTDELPQLEAWRKLGAQWIKEQKSSVRARLLGLRYFFKAYLNDTLAKAGLATEPESVCSRSALLPDFYGSCLTGYAPSVGRVRSNYVHDFLNWVLLTALSVPDDHGRPVVGPQFHNPVPRRERGGGGQVAESVRSPLPYGYIDELRLMLASGPTFADWKWAQDALGGEQLMAGSGNAPDWFEVAETTLDKSDPDCVWRVRERYSSGGPLLEMWSPVRWVALLTKLCLPLRTIQTRLLDSGESDTWRYSSLLTSSPWALNLSRLKEGTERKPQQRGVFRRVQQLAAPSAPQVLLYINTNKTADANLSGAEKGYELPWLTTGPIHNNPLYWLERLRNWQEKYNPVKRRTSWRELGPTRLDAKSEIQLASFPDACFLFRTPEDGAKEAHLPIGGKSLDTPWHRLLQEFEGRLAARGEVHADGSRIRLVREKSALGVYFPLHSLRVSLITALALEGKVPFPILQKIAGHSRLVMTLYYTKLGSEYPAKELEEAAKRLEAKKGESILKFLRETEYKALVNEAVCNSKAALAAAIDEHPASRNAAGWMPMHHGLCVVGGNTSQLEGNSSIGGCYNGGVNIGSQSSPRYAPTPGGARNCVRCRWFVTEPHYLWALQAHANTLFYHSDEAMLASVKSERTLGELRAERALAEEKGEAFLKHDLLAQTERVYEAHMNRYSELTHDVAATVRLMQRCVEQARKLDGRGDDATALIAVGSSLDIQLAVEEVSSELLQLAGVCEAAEVYPDVSPGKAVFRRAQLLDAALARDGMPPLFMTLSEEEQLITGNAFLRRLAKSMNPDSNSLGLRQVIELIDAGESLSAMLKIDVRKLLHESGGTVSKKVLALEADNE